VTESAPPPKTKLDDGLAALLLLLAWLGLAAASQQWVFLIPLLLAYSRIARTDWLRAACWLSVVVSGVAALTAFSRTGIILLVLITPLLYFQGIIRLNPWHLLAFAAAIVGVFVFAPEALVERVFSLESYTLAGSESLRHRVDLLAAGWDALTSNPLNGLGIENTWGIFDYYDYPDTGTIITVHNGYLQWALEVGWLGLILLLLYFWQLTRRNLDAPRTFLSTSNPEMALISCALLVSLVAFLLAGFTVDFLRIGFKNMWVLMGLMVAAHQLALAASREALAVASRGHGRGGATPEGGAQRAHDVAPLPQRHPRRRRAIHGHGSRAVPPGARPQPGDAQRAPRAGCRQRLRGA